jgi:hypothetical protein
LLSFFTCIKVVSDSYISFWLDALDAGFPNDYQVMTIWIASSEDLTAVSHLARTLKHMLHGRHHAAMYFLWPAQCQDAQFIPSGYVDLPTVMAAMTSMEGSGITTRFPHNSHLYKVFLSKDWTSQVIFMCVPWQ